MRHCQYIWILRPEMKIFYPITYEMCDSIIFRYESGMFLGEQAETIIDLMLAGF